MEDKHRK